jgi:ApaG protein
MVRFVAETDGFTVTVRPTYLDDHSSFWKRRFAFGYYVRIENASGDAAQLLSRYWLIRETPGRTQEVEGAGVVGKQPLILPGGSHEYSSSCVLQSFEGSMEGFYLMQRTDGTQFQITIPRFRLCAAAN